MMRAVLLFLPLVGCAAVSAGTAPVTGSWGGQHIGMKATAVAVSFDFDCAAGRIDGPLLPQANGAFSVNGVYFPGHGGPTRVDEIPRALPAIYRGSISGATMRLSIDLPSEKQVLGPYALRRGAQPAVFRCL